MFVNELIVPVLLKGKKVEIFLFSEDYAPTLIEMHNAIENGEAPFQIIEGCHYEYKITDGYSLALSQIVSQSKINTSCGRISPNIYVGTLNIQILDTNKIDCGKISLEVQSGKTKYREDYRHMLEEITEKCTDLLLQHNSPVSQFFEADQNSAPKTLYQRFAFIKSMLDSVEFNDAINKIASAPVTNWKASETVKNISGIKRINNSSLKQLATSGNRISLPKDHPLKSKLNSIPARIKVSNKIETIDTPENRFVKHALIYFQSFCNDFQTKLVKESRTKQEATLLVDKLEHYLNHSIFKEISLPTTLPLNSPVLQRKEGYREVLRVWLTFNLAAKLIWHGGDDVYSGNKRDVAVLYEYWLFFKLLDIIKEVFKINSVGPEKLIEQTKDGLGLKLKQGRFLPIEGEYVSNTRKLRVEFSYNKTFSGDNKYPASGSWSRSLRPDYTLSIWPSGIEQDQAEREELIVHIHFDAKYKIEKLHDIFDKSENLDEERKEQKNGTYKRADILKMHTYRDAIRRTAGAYVLYPGDKSETKQGFHELLPGLGAFAIRPTKTNNGTDELKTFLNNVIDHFMNRASQREKMSFRTYDAYVKKISSKINASLPETYGPHRSHIPDETFVLVAYYKSKDHLDWIYNSGLYNARAENQKGSLRLGAGEVGAKYLLLHSKNERMSNKILKITENGPRIFSKDTLLSNGYPSKPSQAFYLVYTVEKLDGTQFPIQQWDITKLQGYKGGYESALPFSVTLTELLEDKE